MRTPRTATFAPPPQSSSSPQIKAPLAIRGIALPIIDSLPPSVAAAPDLFVASRRGGCWSGWIRASSAPSSPSPGSFSSSPDSEATYITRRDPAIRVVRSPEARPRAPGPPRRRAEDPGPAVHRGASGPAGAPCNLVFCAFSPQEPPKRCTSLRSSDPGEARSFVLLSRPPRNHLLCSNTP